jgi:hypothetical protein
MSKGIIFDNSMPFYHFGQIETALFLLNNQRILITIQTALCVSQKATY